MYTTSRDVAGGTFMICKECGHAVGMNKMCETPLQSATNILKHMATHNVSHAFKSGGHVPLHLTTVVPLYLSLGLQAMANKI
jgi:hypothetical protein